MRSVIYLAALSFMLSLPAGSQQPAAPIELTLAHTGDRGSIHDLSASEFARRVNANLRGKVFINVVGSSQAGNEAVMLGKLQRGELALSLPAPTLIGVDKVFAVFELPYLVLSRDNVRRARSELVNTYFQPAAEAHGLHILGLWENGFRHITNNVHPIVEPIDLRDIKLRVSQGSSLKKVFEAFGAAPKEFPFGPPLINALKTGEFDGQENPFGNIYTAKIYEVQKYLSLTAHQYGPLYLVASKQIWDSLPEDDRTVIAKIAVDMQDWAMAAGLQIEKVYRAKLAEKMSINDVDTLSFVIASLPIYKSYAKEVPHGRELIRLLYDRSSFAKAGEEW